MGKKKTTLFEHYPAKYIEIAQAVGSGKPASLTCPSPNIALSVVFQFNCWRKALREIVEGGKGEDFHKNLLPIAESVIAKSKKGKCVVTFEYRESSDRVKLLETVQIGGGDVKTV